MLIPKEKPYLQGLNSYYLDIPKLIEHLQGEIGSGCLICKGVKQELLLYFDESNILRTLVQDAGERARIAKDFQSVLQALAQKSFHVAIYHLDENSIYFWAQMPPFNRVKENITSASIPLNELVDKLQNKSFSGFIDLNLTGSQQSAILFFLQGQYKGGSFSWSSGGLNSSKSDYNTLMALAGADITEYKIGYFRMKSTVKKEEATIEELEEVLPDVDVELIMEQFVNLYRQTAASLGSADPVMQLQQKALDHLAIYPLLDPFKGLYSIDQHGALRFASKAPKHEIAAAIIDCAWQVIGEIKAQEVFQKALMSWTFRTEAEQLSANLLGRTA